MSLESKNIKKRVHYLIRHLILFKLSFFDLAFSNREKPLKLAEKLTALLVRLALKASLTSRAVRSSAQLS